MPQEGAHVHLIDPSDPTSPVKVATGPPAPTDTGLVVHVASQPAGGGGVDPVAIKDGTTATQKLAVDVNGRVGVNNFPASQAVTGTFWPATQPVSGTVTANAGTGTMAVSGPLTDTQLRASRVPVDGSGVTQPVSGTFWPATQPVSLATNTPDVTDRAARLLGHVTVDQAPITAVTGTFWQATQPVSLATAPVTPVTDNAGSLTVDSGQLPAALAAGGGLKVEGVAGGVPQPVSISSAPVLQVGPPPVASKKATYSVCAAALAPAALATDVFTIYGSATKTVVVEKLIIDGIQTTAGSIQFLVIKRSAANTGGTSSAPAKVPYDSTQAAATATVAAYTANPTGLGAAVGNVRSDRIFLPGAATAVDAQGRIFSFGEADQRGVVLRGTAEGLAVNLNGVTVAGGSFNINVEFTEE